MHRWLSFLIVVWMFGGCGGHVPHPSSLKREKLAHALEGLAQDIPKGEAIRLSEDIYANTEQLAKEFEMVSPPQYHNFLVRVGLRKKGLCYQWADALYAHLKIQGYEDFDFHLIGANIGKYWTEHNALVVVAKGCDSDACILRNGIIIDGWRNAGELYFSTVQADKSYVWHHRSNRCYAGK